ncbi:hypothetical protein BN2476_430007 [Paraburkholderia piptadeniae]|uniref:Uncharacterized protein n=1 Tax=Paraburkholderia piptadeniae TaxID=1701573 RepID=A0A1N7SBD5_9BURK|nr:hypothetical protein BN2476_430007 [Paraburkholderia piptadeniae]
MGSPYSMLHSTDFYQLRKGFVTGLSQSDLRS